jgi:hypothetical protein
MKKLILLLNGFMIVLIADAQVTPYTGGNGSGYRGVASAATACPFYFGGITDGASSNRTPSLVCVPYFGGKGDGFAMQTAVCPVALPLTLISFFGERDAQRNVLQWKLADDWQVSYIAIEKSANGVDYKTVGRIAGVTDYRNQYRFIDHSPYTGRNFYRLRITDQYDKVTYSRVLLMKDQYSTAARVYPNPAASEATLYYEATEPANSNLSICQYDGRIVFTLPIQLAKGANFIHLNLQGLINGFYFIRVGSSTGRIKLMILKK